MSEELLVSLIRERWCDIQDRASILDRITELDKMLNTRQDPVPYDEALVLADLHNDWRTELNDLIARERLTGLDIAATEKHIEKIVPYNIPIKLMVDEMEWVVWKPFGGSVEVRGHERKSTTD